MTLHENRSALSPLEQIRQAEIDVTRRVAAALEEAEQALAKARKETASIKNQAFETGRKKGQAKVKEIVDSSESEANNLITQAHHQAKQLHLAGRQYMEEAVRCATQFIAGYDENTREQQ